MKLVSFCRHKFFQMKFNCHVQYILSNKCTQFFLFQWRTQGGNRGVQTPHFSRIWSSRFFQKRCETHGGGKKGVSPHLRELEERSLKNFHHTPPHYFGPGYATVLFHPIIPITVIGRQMRIDDTALAPTLWFYLEKVSVVLQRRERGKFQCVDR